MVSGEQPFKPYFVYLWRDGNNFHLKRVGVCFQWKNTCYKSLALYLAHDRCSKSIPKERKRGTYPVSKIIIKYIYIYICLSMCICVLYFTKNFSRYYLTWSPKLSAETKIIISMKSILQINWGIRQLITLSETSCLNRIANQTKPNQNQTKTKTPHIHSKESLVVIHLRHVAFLEVSSTG